MSDESATPSDYENRMVGEAVRPASPMFGEIGRMAENLSQMVNGLRHVAEEQPVPVHMLGDDVDLVVAFVHPVPDSYGDLQHSWYFMWEDLDETFLEVFMKGGKVSVHDPKTGFAFPHKDGTLYVVPAHNVAAIQVRPLPTPE